MTIKTLDEPRIKKFVPAFKVKASTIDAEKRTLSATISDNTVDRDGDIVVPGAFADRIETFTRNPLLLWMHNSFGFPIGHVPELNIGKDSIEALMKFRPAGDDETADNVFSAFVSGDLRSFSIGFRVFKIDEPEFDEKTGKPTSPPKIVDAELFEVSAVTVPSNTNAIAKHATMATLLGEGLQVYCKATGEKMPKGLALPRGAVSDQVIYSKPDDLDLLKHAAELVATKLPKLSEASPEEVAALRDLRRAFVGSSELVRVEEEAEASALLEAALADLDSFGKS